MPVPEAPIERDDHGAYVVGDGWFVLNARDARWPAVVLGIGARAHQEGDVWGGYPVSELALRHGVGVRTETSDADEAYAGYPEPVPARYGDWLS